MVKYLYIKYALLISYLWQHQPTKLETLMTSHATKIQVGARGKE